MTELTVEQMDQGFCPNTRDGHGHCVHWWDAEAACCWCAHPTDLSGDEVPDDWTGDAT